MNRCPLTTATGNSGVVQRLGRRQKQDEPLLLIEPDNILEGSLALPAM